jgi:hypothetical protein
MGAMGLFDLSGSTGRYYGTTQMKYFKHPMSPLSYFQTRTCSFESFMCH